jgi:hypothetical protein
MDKLEIKQGSFIQQEISTVHTNAVTESVEVLYEHAGLDINVCPIVHA